MDNLFRHAASVSVLTLASRVLGVVRDAVIAAIFGTSIVSDTFFLAFRPFELIRKLFSDGILSLSFVPVFSAYLARGKKDEAIAMFWSALFLLSVASVLLVSLGIYAAPFLAKVLAPGFAEETYAHTLTVLLLKIMLPYLFMVLFLALSMGMLTAMGSFKGPAATPILLNAGIIASVMALSPEPRVLALGMGVTLGGLIQLGFQIPFLIRSGIKMPAGFRWVHPGVVLAGKRFFPCVFGASAFQINLVISALFASTLSEGSISYLYFAERLVQFPLALLATSAATVFLPTLSKASQREGTPDFEGFEDGAKMVLFLTIGAMAGIMALNDHIVALLFGRGAFGSQAIVQTADCLFLLVSGLWAMAGTRLYVTCHFAASRVRLPMIASSVSLLVHVTAACFLKDSFGVPGLAVALALGSICGFFVLGIFSRIGPTMTSLMVSACRALFVSGIMACVVQWAADYLLPAQGPLIYRACLLAAIICLGGITFFVTAAFGARPEMTILKKMLKKHHVRS